METRDKLFLNNILALGEVIPAMLGDLTYVSFLISLSLRPSVSRNFFQNASKMKTVKYEIPSGFLSYIIQDGRHAFELEYHMEQNWELRNHKV